MKKNRRVVLKLSGEVFHSSHLKPNDLLDQNLVKQVIDQLKILVKNNYEIVIVLGGGNICRGSRVMPFNDVNYSKLDYAGMLATIVNGLVFQQFCQHHQIYIPALSMLQIGEQVMPNYHADLAQKLLLKYGVIIVVGGLGRPFFSTDTVTSWLAHQLQAELVLLGKNHVDGVYNSDPQHNDNATKYRHLTYHDFIKQKLHVFDLTAASFNLDKKIKTLVFNLSKPNAIINTLNGKGSFTEVSNYD